MAEKNLIDSYGVVEILGISRPTLAKYIKQGYIVPTQFSVTGRHLFDVDYIKGIKEKLSEDAAKEDEFVSPSEAARMLGVCPATIGEYERKGLLVVVKRPTAHRKLYSKADVMGLMNKAKGKFLTTEELAKEFKCSPALIAYMDSENLIQSEKKTHTNVKYYGRDAYEKLKTLLED